MVRCHRLSIATAASETTSDQVGCCSRSLWSVQSHWLGSLRLVGDFVKIDARAEIEAAGFGAPFF